MPKALRGKYSSPIQRIVGPAENSIVIQPMSSSSNSRSSGHVEKAPSPSVSVAVVVDPGRRFDRAVATGVAAYARGLAGWRVHVEPQPFPANVGRRAGVFGCGLGDGVVTLDTYGHVIRAAAAAGLPVVAVAAGFDTAPPAGVPVVAIDEERVATLAAEHLLEQGCRRFGFFGLETASAAAWSEPRARAFARRVNEAGCGCETLLAGNAASDSASLRRELAAWVEALPRPVGIMACDDQRAAQVLEVCEVLRLRVPEDVAVIGAGDDALVRELPIPPLSSIALPLRVMGYEAARLLQRMIRPDAGARSRAGRTPVPARIALPPNGVMVRQSTTMLAIDDPVVSAAIKTINAEAVNGLTIEDLVRRSKLSRWQLDQRFGRALDRSVHQQILHVRLAEARRLVVSTNVPLKSVAKQAGFRSISYMTTLFKRTFAATPAVLRNTAGGRGTLGGSWPPHAEFSSGDD